MREHNNRIRLEKIELNKSALQEFFQARSEKYDSDKPYVGVLYKYTMPNLIALLFLISSCLLAIMELIAHRV